MLALNPVVCYSTGPSIVWRLEFIPGSEFIYSDIALKWSN